MTKEQVYRCAGLTRQGYFKMRQLAEEWHLKEQAALEQVRKYRIHQTRSGARVMHQLLKIESMGINKFERLVAENQLGAKIKSKYIRTTQGTHEEEDQNLLYGFELTSINQVFVGDITYFHSENNKVFYIFTLKDAYSKFIVGLDGFENMYAQNALTVLEQVIACRGKENLKGAIHHTDGGGQYRADIYKERLEDCKMIRSISMNCLENGIAEQLNFIIKDHQLPHYKITTISSLKKALVKVKHFLNYIRPIKGLGYRTPNEFEQWVASMKIEERPKQTLYDFSKDK
jgi:putative transposase